MCFIFALAPLGSHTELRQITVGSTKNVREASELRNGLFFQLSAWLSGLEAQLKLLGQQFDSGNL